MVSPQIVFTYPIYHAKLTSFTLFCIGSKFWNVFIFKVAMKLFKKYTFLAWSDQTFIGAWNQCPILDEHSDWKLLARLYKSNGNMTFSHWVNLRLALRFRALLIMMILSLEVELFEIIHES